MQYVIVDGGRSEPFVGGKGCCPMCGAEMIAKCGPRVLHHWAHKGRRNCDPWWENETDWHREWKGYFPENCREIHHKAEDGGIHRADVMTPNGIYVEFQHSSMPEAERKARETFYGNLLWIIDGRGFRNNFNVYHKLPHPNSAVASDIIWFKARRDLSGTWGGMFYRLTETQRDYPDKVLIKSTIGALDTLVKVHSFNEIRSEVDETYRGHHQYDWIRPIGVWLESPCPIFIDFGDHLLVKLEIYDDSGLPCIRYVTKSHLVQGMMLKSDARAVCNEWQPSAMVSGSTKENLYPGTDLSANLTVSHLP